MSASCRSLQAAPACINLKFDTKSSTQLKTSLSTRCEMMSGPRCMRLPSTKTLCMAMLITFRMLITIGRHRGRTLATLLISVRNPNKYICSILPMVQAPHSQVMSVYTSHRVGTAFLLLANPTHGKYFHPCQNLRYESIQLTAPHLRLAELECISPPQFCCLVYDTLHVHTPSLNFIQQPLTCRRKHLRL